MAPAVKLTRRGQEVAELVALGLSNREIAQRLFLSERTIEWHVEQILNRLGFTSRSQVAAWIGRTQVGSVVREPGSRVGNLPAPLTSFVGRDFELAALKDLLEANRLLTVCGPGGIGKTRLALRLAEALEPSYANGAWLCELAPLADPALVGDAIAQALDVVSDGPDRLAAVSKHLRERTVLLVLDNCEHVLDSASAVAQKLLAGSHGLRILATSRAPLEMLGEAVWRLDPLTEEAAIRLFTQRAQAASPGFALDSGNSKAVATICQRLDGVPLALELVAPKLRVLDVEALAEVVLDPAWQVHSTARHGSMQAAADWSYRLLGPGEQALFRRLGVFAGWFDVEDATALAHATAEVPKLLASLVEKSMVVAQGLPEGARRFRLLEMLRVFARERLEQGGEMVEARMAHADAMAGVAERAGMDDQRPGWAGTKIVAMVDDMRAALSTYLESRQDRAAWLAAALVLTWRASGRISEGLRWITAALEANPDQSNERIWLLLAYSGLLLDLGKRNEAKELFLKAVSTEGFAGGTIVGGKLPFGPAVLQVLVSDHAASEGLLRQVIQEYEQAGDIRFAGAFMNTLAMSLLYQGRAQEARELAQRSVEIRRSETLQYFGALDTLAEAHALLGDAEQARASWLEAMPMVIQSGIAINVAGCLEGLALAAGMREKKEIALRLHHCAEHLLADLDIRYSEPIEPKLRALLARLREKVGQELAAQLQAEGEALSPAEAFELAATEG